MKTIYQLFEDTWRKKEDRKWEYVYIMVDLHGVVLPPNYHKHSDLNFLSPFTERVLQYLSQQRDVKLILWSSSHMEEIKNVTQWLNRHGIHFDFVNENPLEKNTDYADISKKPYFSVVLDDKAGFESCDWESISCWIKNRELAKLK